MPKTKPTKKLPIVLDASDGVSDAEASAAGQILNQRKQEKAYHIVNPAGAVHAVTREHAQLRLRQIGFRMATPDEIAAYQKRAVQAFDNPIAEPFAPTPDETPELD